LTTGAVEEVKALPICPKCGRAAGGDNVNFCSHCGVPLQSEAVGGRHTASRWRRMIMPGILAVLSAAVLVWMLRAGPTGPAAPPAVEGTGGGLKSPGGPNAVEPSTGPVEGGPLKAVAGNVVVSHHTGLDLAVIPAAVVSSWWVALPVHACYGGDVWLFHSVEGRPFRLVSGSWRDGEPVALWRLEEGGAFPGPGLRQWRPGVPVSWRSLGSGGEVRDVDIHV
jgi:ribosomal protein L37E